MNGVKQALKLLLAASLTYGVVLIQSQLLPGEPVNPTADQPVTEASPTPRPTSSAASTSADEPMADGGQPVTNSGKKSGSTSMTATTGRTSGGGGTAIASPSPVPVIQACGGAVGSVVRSVPIVGNVCD